MGEDPVREGSGGAIPGFQEARRDIAHGSARRGQRLSRRPRLLYDYFRQLFAQVTNPPLDAIREKLVTSLAATIGREHNLFAETPLHCRQLELERPILTPAELAAIRHADSEDLQSAELSICWPLADGGQGLAHALESLCRYAALRVEAGARLLILTDREIPSGQAPIPVCG